MGYCCKRAKSEQHSEIKWKRTLEAVKKNNKKAAAFIVFLGYAGDSVYPNALWAHTVKRNHKCSIVSGNFIKAPFLLSLTYTHVLIARLLGNKVIAPLCLTCFSRFSSCSATVKQICTSILMVDFSFPHFLKGVSEELGREDYQWLLLKEWHHQKIKLSSWTDTEFLEIMLLVIILRYEHGEQLCDRILSQ